MKNINYSSNAIVNNLISMKFPFRFLAVIGIFLLGIVTIAVTYRTIIDAWEFFHLSHLLANKLYKQLNLLTSILIGVATVTQSYSAVWDQLSYWGQVIDNSIIKLITGKEYFLDEVDAELHLIRKLLNSTTAEFQQCYWSADIKNKSSDKSNIAPKLEAMLKNNVAKATKSYNKVIKLLKENECYDNINRQREEEADELLNSLIVQLAITSKQINEYIKQS